jgi:hypothetical protein
MNMINAPPHHIDEWSLLKFIAIFNYNDTFQNKINIYKNKFKNDWNFETFFLNGIIIENCINFLGAITSILNDAKSNSVISCLHR